MAPKARRKSGLDSNAAYSASQPLFDALRLGVEQLNEERDRLAVARDLVQNLHVKIVNEAPHQDKSCHKQYIENILMAWRNTAKVYIDIFEHLTDITAANPTEGRHASEGHQQFRTIFESLVHSHIITALTEPPKKSNQRATSVPAASDSDTNDSEDQATPDGMRNRSKVERDDGFSGPRTAHASTSVPIVNSNGKRLLVESDQQNLHSPQPPAGVQQSTTSEARLPKRPRTVDTRAGEKEIDGVMYSGSGTELWRFGAEQPTVPFELLTEAQQDLWRLEKIRQRRRRKKARKRSAARSAQVESQNTTGGSRPTSNGPAQTDNAVPVPRVEFEDVTAEASARLKFNEDERLAKKQQQQKKKKKRKRESTESNVINEDFFDDPLAALEASLAEKPGKKKQRLDEETQKDTVTETQSPRRNPKRKHVADELDGREIKKPNAKKNTSRNS